MLEKVVVVVPVKATCRNMFVHLHCITAKVMVTVTQSENSLSCLLSKIPTMFQRVTRLKRCIEKKYAAGCGPGPLRQSFAEQNL